MLVDSTLPVARPRAVKQRPSHAEQAGFVYPVEGSVDELRFGV
jgi:hypothetical protein